MTVRELMAVSKYVPVKMYDGHDGKLVTASKKNLELYKDVTVVRVSPMLELNRGKDVASAVLRIYGSHYEIQQIKEGLNK